ncbi:glucose-1-phosphate adenylyltransferase subunit GlgD [Sporolactobacillus shoreicorticis]|uniref:Glucose-1-phosphate adenylyltransferase subunit GlgD n=1 Tax=Sporolactobacillus shoreicorticis TaxID=1923877 RepID=A0ABW5S7W4_9BACL|nr:glucose-1-phosphate adenylyltransferase subunit GlgD [Sporolactobacillus shoreicorticis]MCO7126563.1 glucose-1-phosphate adenylyltransferase subunit GlgD [Sporolactobacillus shoreicorticis]
MEVGAILNQYKICGIVNLSESKQLTNPLTRYRPVAGLPFCSSYRLIDFPLSNLVSAGVESIGIFMNGQYQSIYDHVLNGSDWDLDSLNGGIFFFDSGTEQINGLIRDDLEAFHNNLEFIEKSRSDFVIIMGSRALCNIDVQAVLRHHLEQKAEITLVYKTISCSAADDRPITCVELDENNRIRKMKSCMLRHDGQSAVNMEIYVMRCSLYAQIVRRFMAWNEVYNLRDAIHQAVRTVKTNGYEYTGYFKNITSIKSYYDAHMDMIEEFNRSALFGGEHQIHTKIKNEVPSYYGKNTAVSNSLIANGCMINGIISHSLLSRNVVIHKESKIVSSIIMEGSVIGEGVYLSNVIMDKENHIQPGSRIIGSADHPVVIEKKSTIYLGS